MEASLKCVKNMVEVTIYEYELNLKSIFFYSISLIKMCLVQFDISTNI